MRILVVAPMPPSPDAPGAIPRVLHAQVTGLDERHEVAVVCVAGPEEQELEALERLRASGRRVEAVRRREPRTPAERWRRRGRLASGWLHGELPWRSVWFRERSLEGLVARVAAEEQVDLVAVEDSAMGVYRLPVGLPAILTEHEVRRARPVRLPPAGREWPAAVLHELDWQRWPEYQRRVWARFRLVQTFTSRDAAALRELAPTLADRVRVVPFGLDIPEPEVRPETPSSVVFVGNFTHQPNVDAALWLGREIVPRLRARGARPTVTIAGPAAPPSVQALEGPDLRVPGHVDDLPALLAESAVVVAPIRTGGGMRVKVLEALASGKAVVTTPRGAEGLAQGAPLAIGRDAGELAARIAELLDDPEARAGLGRRARAFAAEQHGPQAYAARLERSYEEAVRRGAARAAAR